MAPILSESAAYVPLYASTGLYNQVQLDICLLLYMGHFVNAL